MQKERFSCLPQRAEEDQDQAAGVPRAVHDGSRQEESPLPCAGAAGALVWRVPAEDSWALRDRSVARCAPGTVRKLQKRDLKPQTLQSPACHLDLCSRDMTVPAVGEESRGKGHSAGRALQSQQPRVLEAVRLGKGVSVSMLQLEKASRILSCLQ